MEQETPPFSSKPTDRSPGKPTGAKRGRKPRQIVAHEANGRPVFYSALQIRTERCEEAAILRLVGTLDAETLIELRDSAFTVIGAKPHELCLDLRQVAVPLERYALESLVTICRVARMVKVGFSVIVPPTLDASWQRAGLHRLLPVQENPRYSQPGILADFAPPVVSDTLSA